MHKILVLGLVASLAGCSSLPNLFGPDSAEDDPAVTAAAAPMPAAMAEAADDTFCRDAAQQAVTNQGFDEATQKRMALQTYAQCRAMAPTSR